MSIQTAADFKIIADQSLAGEVVIANGVIVNCNRAFESICGYTAAELAALDKNVIATIFKGKTLKLLISLINLCLKGDQSSHEEAVSMVRKNGSPGTIEVLLHPFRYKNSPAIHLSCLDISDRNRLELSLREAGEKLNTFLENTLEGIALFGEDGAVTEWNRGMEIITGIGGGETIGKPGWDVLYGMVCDEEKSEELYSILKAFFIEMLTTGTATMQNPWVGTIQRPDGIRRIVEHSAFSVSTNGGLRIGSMVRDVSELKASHDALRKSEEKYLYLTEWIPDIIFTIARDLTILYVNQNAAQFFGKPVNEIIGKKHRNLFPHEVAIFQEGVFTQVFENGLPHISESKFFDHWLETRLVPIKDKSGVITALLGISFDITRRKIAENQLWEARERADAALLAKSTVLANLSDEIHPPMNGILERAELLMHDPHLTPEQTANILAIKKSLQEVLSLVNNCAALSKIEEGAFFKKRKAVIPKIKEKSRR